MTFEEKQFVASLAELDAMVPPAGEGAAGKTMRRIERYAQQFIDLSPFCCLATSDGKGNADVTPRGDKPGFVRVIDERTLLIPERPGNNRMDSLRNIIQHPSLGLLFLIPGFEDTLRINGRDCWRIRQSMGNCPNSVSWSPWMRRFSTAPRHFAGPDCGIPRPNCPGTPCRPWPGSSWIRWRKWPRRRRRSRPKSPSGMRRSKRITAPSSIEPDSHLRMGLTPWN
jgi:predicted pyridoxine 5'-phosphate oxidase superfamily flavin-nucleotide-binding protein